MAKCYSWNVTTKHTKLPSENGHRWYGAVHVTLRCQPGAPCRFFCNPACSFKSARPTGAVVHICWYLRRFLHGKYAFRLMFVTEEGRQHRRGETKLRSWLVHFPLFVLLQLHGILLFSRRNLQ